MVCFKDTNHCFINPFIEKSMIILYIPSYSIKYGAYYGEGFHLLLTYEDVYIGNYKSYINLTKVFNHE